MKFETEQKVENVLFWIGMPTVMLTENHPKKWVRVMGFLGMLPLFPLAFVFFILFFFWLVVVTFSEI